jgi:hypothetical protein
MSLIILDFGSGETCKNDKSIVRRMINGLAEVDSRKYIVYIKWQLFTHVPAGVPALDHEVYLYAVQYARELGYLTSASVFDAMQLEYLLGFAGYSLPFIKIAARPEKYKLLDKIPPGINIFVSIPRAGWRDYLAEMYPQHDLHWLYCIPEYPANQNAYESLFGGNLSYGISDHSSDLRLFKEYEPRYYERHFKLPDSTGLDAGPFASTPEQLKAIL